MDTVSMMYVLPMLLGQTYDYGKNEAGVQIFPTSLLNSSTVIEHYLTDSQYRVIENTNEIRDFLNIDGKLSLRIKNGMVDASGEGKYLKDSSSKGNGIELLVKVHFETVTETIHSSASPNADWSSVDMKFLGTHYCRSITYGGDLLASVRISSSNVYDAEKIKGVITSNIKAGKALDADIQARLDKLKSDGVDSSTMEINYYASVPIKGVSYTIEGLVKLALEFPEHVKQMNNGKGNPLRMELHSLNSLKEGYPQYLENKALTDQLNDLEDQFDDLRATKRELGLWLSGLPPVIPDNVNEKIRKFSQKLDDIFGIFSKSISDIDLTLGASTKSFEEAFQAYDAGEYTIPQKYSRNFKKLQKEIYKEAPELKWKVGGATYIQWGRQSCKDSTDVETAFSGVAIAGIESENNGFSDIKCSLVDPGLVNLKDFLAGKYNENGSAEQEEAANFSITFPQYTGALTKFEDMRNKSLACAQCRSNERTSTLLKVASKTCPDGYSIEYEGMLMAPSIDGSKGEYICVDIRMQSPQGNGFFEERFNRTMELQEVVVECGSLPCEAYPEGKLIPCAVCTI